MKLSVILFSVLAGILVTLAYFRPRFKFFRDVRGLGLYESVTGDILARRFNLADWEFNLIGKVWNLRIARRQLALWRNYVPVFNFFPQWKRAGQTLALTLVSVVLFAACDGIVAGFRVGLAASKPFVQSLVDSKSITQTQATAAVQDLDDGVGTLANAEDCLNSTKLYKDGAKRVEKAKCYFQAAQSLRGILARRNFEVNDRLNQISLIAAGAIEAFEAYYTKVTGPGSSVASTSAVVMSSDADKELERAIRERKKELDALIKGH